MGVGDEILAAGDARRLRETIGCGPVTILDRRGLPRWHPVWQFCEDVAHPRLNSPHTVTNGGRARPYAVPGKPSREQWEWVDYKPTPARIEIAGSILDRWRGITGVIVEPNIKPGASVNKDWGFDRWQRLVELAPDIPWLQIGPADTTRLPGVRFVQTPTIFDAFAVLSFATAAVLPEGGLHHAAAAVGTRAVVIYGGFISPRQTGYDRHINLFTGGIPCGYRVPCPHCREAMAGISPEMVLKNLRSIL